MIQHHVPVVEFDPNGPEDAEKQYVYAGASTYTGETQMYTVTEKQISKAQSPVWEGYTFQGWYDAKESGNPVSGPITLNSKVMLYAHWKKNLQDSWIQAVESQTYTGGAITPNVTVADGKTTLTAGKDYTVAFENNTNAGTASVKISAVTDSAYTGEATASFTIAKATPVVKAAASGITYGQTLNYSVLTGTARLGKSLVEGTFTWKNVGTEPAVSDSNQTEYDVVFTPDESVNLEEVKLTAKLTVSKAVPTVTFRPAGRSLTYDGSEQELIEAGRAEGGTLVYSLDGETYTESVPTGIEAGRYVVLFKVNGDENHTSAGPFVVTATIARADSSGAPVAKTLFYNGKAQALVEGGTAGGGTMWYALGADENTAPIKGWSDSAPTAIDAGTYYVWYKVVGDGNHRDTEEKCVEVTIAEEKKEEKKEEEKKDDEGGGNPSAKKEITVFDNEPRAYSEETKGDFRIGCCHEIPFAGNGKLTVESFGENFTVLQGNVSYKVKKIKANKKKHRIQILKLENAPKDVEKDVKKATKGDNGILYTQNPYYVRDTDKVTPKFKKSGAAASVKVNINGKDYKAKKTEYDYNEASKLIIFKGDNLAGSWAVK